MDDGVKLAGDRRLPVARRQTPARGPVPGRAGHDSVQPQRRVRLPSAPTFWATRGMVGAVVDVRGTGGSGGNLDGNFFSPREARDGYRAGRALRHPAVLDGEGRDGGRLLPRHHPVPRRRAAAAAPGRDHPGRRAQRPLPRRLRPRRHPQPQLRRSSTSPSRALPARPGRTPTRSCSRRPLRAKLGQSPPGTIAFDYLAPAQRRRRSTATARRSTAPSAIKVPALIIGGWRDGLLRGAPEMYQRLARRRGVETRLYIDPCTHKGCGAPLAPFTDPPGREDLAAVAVRVPRQAPARCARPRPGRACATTCRRANAFVDADRWPPAGTGSTAGRAWGRADAVVRDQPRRRVQPRVQQVRHRRGHPVRARPTSASRALRVVTFRTPALDERPATSSGRPGCTSSPPPRASDTDWHAKLADVAPDGSETLITEGALRASHRALDRAQEHTGPPVPPPHQPAADRAEPLLRLRHRDRADRLPARPRPPAPAAA